MPKRPRTKAGAILLVRGCKNSIAQEERLATSPNCRGGSTNYTQWHEVNVVILSPEISGSVNPVW